MAVVKMKKIELLAMLSDSKAIMDIIQQYGVIEVTDYEEIEGFYKVSTDIALSQLEKFQAAALQAQEILNEYVPVKTSALEFLKPRKEYSVSEYYFKSQEADAILNKCYSITSLYKEIQDKKEAIIQSQTAINTLTPWENLDIPTSFKGTAYTGAFVGSLPEIFDKDTLLSKIAEYAPEAYVEIEIVSTQPNQTCIVAICHKSASSEIENALRKLSFQAPSEPTKHPPELRLSRLRRDIEKYNADILRCEQKIKAYADYREQIDFLTDYFIIRKAKYGALDKISMSNNVFVISGFIPKTDVEKLTDKLQSHFDVAFSISEPDYEKEDVPVAVKNGSFAAPMELITNTYSPPSKMDVDPNPITAVFYYLFFGLMLSDAGYGLIMVLTALFIKLKFKPEKSKIKYVDYFLYCGLGSVFWGAIFGSWFGDIIQVIARDYFDTKIAATAIWFNPIQNPLLFMLIVLLFGILHLLFGNCIKFYELCKNSKVLDAFCDVFPVFLILIGIIPIGITTFAPAVIRQTEIKSVFALITPYFNYAAIIGAVIIVLTSGRANKSFLGKLFGGIYGLYKAAVGYLGDILSYSRLMALGLCTTVMACIINMFGSMAANPFVKIIMLIFIFIIGHTINAAVNTVGAYIHCNRLQYVEFYSKFYEGGGRLFSPLRANTKYFRFKEETD